MGPAPSGIEIALQEGRRGRRNGKNSVGSELNYLENDASLEALIGIFLLMSNQRTELHGLAARESDFFLIRHMVVLRPIS